MLGGARNLAAATCAAALLALPAGASGAVKLGSDLTFAPPGGFNLAAVGCQQGLTGRCSLFTDESSATPAFPATAPGNGVITRWRFRGGCCTEDNDKEHHVVLRVFRQGNWADYEYVKLAVRTGAAYVLPAGGQLLAENIVEVPDRLRISAGQWPGVNMDWPFAMAAKGATGNRIRFMQPAPPDSPPDHAGTGPPHDASASALGDSILQFQAIVEPDGDGDGYGDETQDCAPGNAAVQGGCAPPPPPPSGPPDLLAAAVSCDGGCPGGAGGSGGGGGAVGSPGVVFGSVPPGPAPGGYVVPVACPPGSSVNCTGTVDVTLNGGARSAARKRRAAQVLGRAKFSVAPGKTVNVRVRFSSKARKLLRRMRRASVTVTLRPAGGTPVAIRRTVRLPRR